MVQVLKDRTLGSEPFDGTKVIVATLRSKILKDDEMLAVSKGTTALEEPKVFYLILAVIVPLGFKIKGYVPYVFV